MICHACHPPFVTPLLRARVHYFYYRPNTNIARRRQNFAWSITALQHIDSSVLSLPLPLYFTALYRFRCRRESSSTWSKVTLWIRHHNFSGSHHRRPCGFDFSHGSGSFSAVESWLPILQTWSCLHLFLWTRRFLGDRFYKWRLLNQNCELWWQTPLIKIITALQMSHAWTWFLRFFHCILIIHNWFLVLNTKWKMNMKIRHNIQILCKYIIIPQRFRSWLLTHLCTISHSGSRHCLVIILPAVLILHLCVHSTERVARLEALCRWEPRAPPGCHGSRKETWHAVKSLQSNERGCALSEQHKQGLTDWFKSSVWQLLSEGATQDIAPASLVAGEKEKLCFTNLLRFKPAHIC